MVLDLPNMAYDFVFVHGTLPERYGRVLGLGEVVFRGDAVWVPEQQTWQPVEWRTLVTFDRMLLGYTYRGHRDDRYR